MVRQPDPASDNRIPMVTVALHGEAAVRDAVEGIDAVVHLTPKVHVPRDRDPDPAAADRKVNVEGMRLLAERALDAGPLLSLS